MSSPQVLDSSKIERAKNIAIASASKQKSDDAVADATQKHEDVINAKDSDIDMTDAVAQAGRRLERGVIEKRLRELNPNLYFQRSVNDPNKNGIYRNGSFLCGMEWEASPEFTVNFIGEDQRGRKELLNQVRGWRTVIDMLIRKKVIEAEPTYKLFQVWHGRESARWNALHS
jgi:hypothetical protein